jgi:hypothetical protein
MKQIRELQQKLQHTQQQDISGCTEIKVDAFHDIFDVFFNTRMYANVSW